MLPRLNAPMSASRWEIAERTSLEAADLVLLDDSFPAIVGGVRLGRRIFTNLRKALIYVMAIHVPIAGVALLPILFGMPPPALSDARRHAGTDPSIRCVRLCSNPNQ